MTSCFDQFFSSQTNFWSTKLLQSPAEKNTHPSWVIKDLVRLASAVVAFGPFPRHLSQTRLPLGAWCGDTMGIPEVVDSFHKDNTAWLLMSPFYLGVVLREVRGHTSLDSYGGFRQKSGYPQSSSSISGIFPWFFHESSPISGIFPRFFHDFSPSSDKGG